MFKFLLKRLFGRPVPDMLLELFAVSYKHAMIGAFLDGAAKACDLIVAGAGNSEGFPGSAAAGPGTVN